ncbi:NAD(P)H-dependent oxidoreductase [Sandaracinobacter sp. RS1-74]|uniref:NADPH-dependent FMN reductase n=1 Tax=Sandaracinobacteroides sayramensis TaxID=2913411 RepID=UPI001EDC61A3|nr:NADPH-dependent FMN reductase [Sandaracinobacteroides sayramensis]MCG2842539.1 NAD(P)H-dependent oxidoreductase [Sandaracinobacteroides sayramensis]
MVEILGISGSLRKESLNTRLLHLAAELMPEGSRLTTATLHGIPLYDGDVEEADGIPAAVEALKDAIRKADGVLLVTPEYNNGIPGVFKNAVDWVSRPPKDSAGVFRGRPFAVIGASPGGFGTLLSQNAWLPVLRTLETRFWSEGRFLLSRAHLAFTPEGGLADGKQQEMLRGFLAGFAKFAGKG